MGIILEDKDTNQIVFYLKGADIVMKERVHFCDRIFLSDECDNLAREGLRTLVFAKKNLSPEQYKSWKKKYIKASKHNINI